MSYNNSGPLGISGAIRSLKADYPEEGRPTVAEPTAPPTYSTGNLRKSQPLLNPVDEFDYFQPPEVIRTLPKSNANLNEQDLITTGLNGTSGGGSFSNFRPQNKSIDGPMNSFGYGDDQGQPGSRTDFGRRGGSSYNGSSTGNYRRSNPGNAGNSMTGNDFMDAYNKLHHLN